MTQRLRGFDLPRLKQLGKNFGYLRIQESVNRQRSLYHEFENPLERRHHSLPIKTRKNRGAITRSNVPGLLKLASIYSHPEKFPRSFRIRPMGVRTIARDPGQ